jgi:tetratricopeptide (TPR) repeat protein
MRLVCTLMAGVVALAMAGCIQIPMLRPATGEQLEHWVAQEEYGKALHALDRISPGDPAYVTLQEQRPRIEGLAAGFEKTVAREAAEMTREGQWQQALERYDDGLDKLPESKALQAAREAFLEKRERHVQGLRDRSALDRGGWLVEAVPLQREIVRVVPAETRARRNLARLEAEVEETGQALYICGQRAMARGHDTQAVRCLGLAQELTPTVSVREALSRAEARQAKQRERRRAASRQRRAHATAQREQVLYERYVDAFAGGDLLEARLTLAELEELKPGSAKVQRLQVQLARAIADTVEHGMEAGRRLYSQGRFEQALATWRFLSELDPENEELKAHIARAERVLAKLRTLNEKQPDDQLPGESAEP